MNLSLFTDYSLRVLMFAGIHDRAPFSVDDAAQAYQVSRHHLAKVVNFLSQRGYLAARRGRGGGIRLAQNPDDIRLGALVRATEQGGTPLVECFDPQTNTCPLLRACRLKSALAEAERAFFDSLDQYTLADLLKHPRTLNTALVAAP